MNPHVLVARLDNMGDVLLSGPAVRAVAANASKVTFLAGPRGADAARLLPGVDEVMVFSAGWIDADPLPVDRASTMALVEALAARRVDQAVILTSFHQSALPLALLARLAGVPVTAATSVDYPGSLLDVRHLPDEDVHEVERSLSLVATLGHRLPAADPGWLAVRLPDASPPPTTASPYVVVHPGATVPARTWAPERHAQVVAALASRGHHVVVTGTSDETALTARVAGTTLTRSGPWRPTVTDLGGTTGLVELARVLAGAQVVVAGNTGPAHLAASVGTPVVSLFAPTVPACRWRPWGVPHQILGDQEVVCAGCRARVCPIPGHPCLGTVTVDEVVKAVESLSAGGSQSSAGTIGAGPGDAGSRAPAVGVLTR